MRARDYKFITLFFGVQAVFLAVMGGLDAWSKSSDTHDLAIACFALSFLVPYLGHIFVLRRTQLLGGVPPIARMLLLGVISLVLVFLGWALVLALFAATGFLKPNG